MSVLLQQRKCVGLVITNEIRPCYYIQSVGLITVPLMNRISFVNIVMYLYVKVLFFFAYFTMVLIRVISRQFIYESGNHNKTDTLDVVIRPNFICYNKTDTFSML